jgi:hypothetical protein
MNVLVEIEKGKDIRMCFERTKRKRNCEVSPYNFIESVSFLSVYIILLSANSYKRGVY